MSLILDALRKSEAERRRREAPNLYSGLPTPTTRERPAWLRAAPWLLVALLVVAAVFALLRRDDAPATKAELAREAEVPLTNPAAMAPPDTAMEPPVAGAAPPVVNAASAAAPAPTVDALVKPAAPPVTMPTNAAAPPVLAPSPIPTPMPTPTPIEPAPPAEEELPPLAVLEPSTRTSLPPLKLSMHVYNSEPARRFAIIDGQRVTEGAQLGSAVVTEIRRDGVVLDVGGRRVIVPRP